MEFRLSPDGEALPPNPPVSADVRREAEARGLTARRGGAKLHLEP